MRVPYIYRMRTVIESPTFQKQAEKRWAEDESLAFIDWIAANPLSGDVIPDADGARKVRWGRFGSGKSGGARVIYFNLTEQHIVLLVAAYAQAGVVRVTTPEQMLVRQARQKSGLTQAALAERIATPPATLRDWEQG